MTDHQPTTLMTGATGFLGQYVLKELLLRGRRVVAILRAPLQDSRRRLAGMLRPLGAEIDDYISSGQLILREGALPEDLPDGEWGPTDDILACAASLQLFSKGNGEPHRTNIDGTATLLEWADRHHVEKIHSISTAYVCGSHTETIREVFHPRPASFQTEYEETKWVAEEMLANWSNGNGNKLTVMRPSFIIGDSTTGYTTQFGGFYQFVRFISLLKAEFGGGNGHVSHIPHRIPGRADDRIQNLVPVDYAARMVAEIVLDPKLHGRIYHLTDPNPPTWELLKKGLEDFFGITGGTFAENHDLPSDKTVVESLMFEKYDLLMPRLKHQPVFDESNTREVRQALGIDYPALTLQRLSTLLGYAVQQRWGQRATRRHDRGD